MEEKEKMKLLEDGILTERQIAFLDIFTRGSRWIYDYKTGLVDVRGDVRLHNVVVVEGEKDVQLDSFQGIKFGVVSGDFLCGRNALTSLEGAPHTVGGRFDCSRNPLTSLEGSPQWVGEDFTCYQTNITSLEGGPKRAKNFYCSECQLTSLEGAPILVEKEFSAPDNPVPEKVFKDIIREMKKGYSYEHILKLKWKRIPVEYKVLLYRPHFDWIEWKETGVLEKVKKGVDSLNRFKAIEKLM
jgi:hypothetical protein